LEHRDKDKLLAQFVLSEFYSHLTIEGPLHRCVLYLHIVRTLLALQFGLNAARNANHYGCVLLNGWLSTYGTFFSLTLDMRISKGIDGRLGSFQDSTS